MYFLAFLLLISISAFSCQQTEDITHRKAAEKRGDTDVDRPLQLVAPAEDHKSLIVVKENLKYLTDIKGPVAVVSVVGKFHSGKSFLMNQLMGKSNGFGIGPSVKPMTMGIWMWGKPAIMTLSNGLKVSIIFLDTEGFAANNVSENYDAKIFAVSTLLSSHLLYNSVKIIDQADIDYLEVLARRTQLFALRSQMSRSKWTNNFNENLLSFPPLLWIVQDFYQDTLDGETAQEWLHRLMTTHTRETEDYQISILDIFKSVDCHTLFLPATTKKLLNNLSLAKEEDLTVEYRQERDELISKLKQRIKPKEKSNKPISGNELAFLLDVLVNAANDGSLADIPSRWHSFVERLQQTATEDCLKFYEDELKQFIGDKNSDKPVKETILIDWHNQTQVRAIELLSHLLQGLDDALEEALQTLESKIELVFAMSKDLNAKKIRLRIIEIHNGIEIKTEDYLRRLQLPIRSSELNVEVEKVIQKVSHEFLIEIREFIDPGSESILIDALVKSISGIAANVELSNNNKIGEFLSNAMKDSIEKFNEMVGEEKTNAPRKPTVLKKAIEESMKIASQLYSQKTKIFQEESIYAAQLSLLNEKLLSRKKTVENDNEVLATKYMKIQGSNLVDSFTERTNGDRISLPINDTDLEARLKVEVSRVLKEFEEILGEFIVYSSYFSTQEELKQKVNAICDLRRKENVRAFAKEVKKPLEIAKRIIILSEDKYTTVFSYKQFIRSVCLLNLDEGKPKTWPLALKSQIIEDFMQTNEEISETIKKKEGFLSAIIGFFQWLLWLFRLN